MTGIEKTKNFNFNFFFFISQSISLSLETVEFAISPTQTLCCKELQLFTPFAHHISDRFIGIGHFTVLKSV